MKTFSSFQNLRQNVLYRFLHFFASSIENFMKKMKEKEINFQCRYHLQNPWKYFTILNSMESCHPDTGKLWFLPNHLSMPARIDRIRILVSSLLVFAWFCFESCLTVQCSNPFNSRRCNQHYVYCSH